MTTEAPQLPFGPYFFLYFLLLWTAILLLLSFTGGWQSLAQRYCSSGQFDGPRWSFQSASLRWTTSYNHCLTVGASVDGLYLAVFFPFRIGHPPLFIPWQEISIEERGRLLLWHYVKLRLGCEAQIPFRISERLAARVRTAAGSAWPERVDSPSFQSRGS